MSSHYLRKYGVAVTIPFELYKLDGTGLKVDAASATGDITLYRDEGANEVLDADAFVDEGVSYSLVLSQAEMTAKHIIVHIVDQSNPQVWLDKVLIIETYGNASAEHIFDLGAATVNLSSTSETQIDDIQTDVAAVHTHINDIHDTDLPDVKSDTAAIKTMTDKIGTITNTGGTATIGAVLGDAANVSLVSRISVLSDIIEMLDAITLMTNHIHDTDLPVVKTDTAAIKAITDLLTLAAINAEVDAALNTVVPSTNTANSVNDILLDKVAVKLPTNYIMGSAVQTDKDDDIDAIAANAVILKKIGVNKWAIVGTSLIIYDDNGSTPLYTFTLDSATAPTSRTPA